MRLKLWSRKEREEDFDEELRSHFRMAVQDRLERGETPEEAEAAARREFGNVGLVKEVTRRMWGWVWLEQLLQDLRYGMRSLRRAPGFTVVAVLTLALGISANTAIFSVVNTVLLRPLPFAESERLITPLGEKNSSSVRTVVSYPDYLDWREQTQTLEHIAAYRHSSMLLRRGDAEPELIYGANVSADLFPLLRVQPVLGRAFTRAEDEPKSEPVILISYGVWQRRFNSDPNVIGQQLPRGGAGPGATIIGVLPEGFKFPVQASRTDFLRPLAPALGEWAERRGAYSLRVIARLKSGVTAQQADSEMRTIGERLEQQYPDEGFRLGGRFVSLYEEVVGNVRTSLLVLLGAVCLVLLIACANVANLLLARATARHREVAIRTALGASHWRVIRQLFTESLLLSLMGGALGLLLAVWGVDLLVANSMLNIPRLKDVSLDGRVLAFTFAISALTGILFGLAPTLQSRRIDLHEALKEGVRNTTAGPSRSRVRGLLVVSEVALSLVLLIGAGLLIKSFVRLRSVNPGFDPEHVLTTDLSLSKVKYPAPEQQQAFFSQLIERLRSVPGVESAAVIYPLPFGGTSSGNSFIIDGRPEPAPGEKPTANYRAVSPDYFQLLRIPLIRGRAFSEQDGGKAPPVLIINETFARRFFPGQDPLGQRVAIERARGDKAVQDMREIVGVVKDVRHEGLDEEAGPEFYVPYMQAPEAYMNVVVRTAGANSVGMSASLREAIRAADREQYVPGIQPMTELLAESIADRRFNVLLTGLFAGVALLLASVGIYGVMAYTVSRRTHEIGVRMALGARKGDVLRLVLRQGLRLILFGVALGVAAALLLTRLLAGMLYDVAPTDPMTFTAVALLLTFVALVACYVPARRATKVDPLIALRYE
ncbi:MAG TPA: ABC transporter permease [Pyrinomonadaceae bacterium]|nr:ABC transporter permease [Pyrinomonadaceae bacterium]